ncbi:hypothetical protein like AT3G60580 [Hibiscus trionum]|uniref:C2H2-type domain-containing protein n=1 Tax=Hibiscus trionum TaxID=183268 RepID=A0A9W7LVG6_HIBTR|nr:hypothetical protein like AT3G60580 [Hibiscus trionum]
MEKNKTPRLCGICNRSFANGKAMGGHMRSHLLKLKLPLSSPTEPDSPTARRSKRLRKLGFNSPSLSTEDAAICLLMLSRDHHEQNPEPQTEEYTVHESLDVDAGNGGGAGAGEDTENDELCSNMIAKAHPKYYKCETCNRSFRSHQALGGHRASHSHKNKQILEEEDDEDCGDIHVQRRIFECPFCDKVFRSGQALGGHKKVHFAYLPATVQSFDLNFPASTDDIDDDDDEEEEASLVADSAPSIYGQSG